MLDLFIMKQMMRLLHAPIGIYNDRGEILQALDGTDEKKLLGTADFKLMEQKNAVRRSTELIAGSEHRLRGVDFPYIHLEENGVACCIMQSDEPGQFIGLGKLRIYSFADEEGRQYPYCGKDEFASIVLILWKMLSGRELGIRQLWDENVGIGFSLHVQMTKDTFEVQEEGRHHVPYQHELRVRDSIRRGDVEELKRIMDEGYSGTVGILANDEARRCKNAAISVISGAARSAIEGGINPERAFSMEDSFICNIEENLSEPIKIEQAAREAELEFAACVHALKRKTDENPLIDQVRDYVFCHIHEPIRVSDIAGSIGVTPNYLSEQFSSAMGMSLKQYIIEEKIVNSEQLLKYTDYSLQEISSYCAFSSQSRFTEYFQRKNGITPAKYRKRCREGKMNKE